MTGPLVPVPSLPLRLPQVGEEAVVLSAMGGLQIGTGVEALTASLTNDEVLVLAAALLNIYGGHEHHRVINLGGPLPEPGSEESDLLLDGTTGTDSEVMEIVAQGLAVLEARAVAPKHDPAEVSAIGKHLVRAGHGNLAIRDVVAVLDALAAVRADTTGSAS